jgi:hypothetical protein
MNGPGLVDSPRPRGPGVSSLAYNRRFFAIPGLSSDYNLLVLQIESVVQAIYNLLQAKRSLPTKFIFGYSWVLPLWDGVIIPAVIPPACLL